MHCICFLKIQNPLIAGIVKNFNMLIYVNSLLSKRHNKDGAKGLSSQDSGGYIFDSGLSL